MNYLILINGAGGHRPFYARVGEELRARGHKVVYALDSHYTDYLYPDAVLVPPMEYFSDYLERHFEAPPVVRPDLLALNVWTAFFPDLDRFMTSGGAYRRIPDYYPRVLRCLLAFFDELISKEAIDFVVYENVSNSFVYTCFLVAQNRGAGYVGFVMSRLPGRADVVDGKFVRDSWTKEAYHDVLQGRVDVPAEVRAQVDHYLATFDAQLPDYLVKNPVHQGVLERYGARAPLRTFVRSMRYLIGSHHQYLFSYQLGNPAWVFPEQFVREVIRSPKLAWVRRRYYRDALPEGPFFVYPIQFHPESATSVDGPHFVDEWNNVRNVAINMPFGVQLVVKDHKNAAAMQPLWFYENVSKLPNVTLLDCNADARAMLRKSAAVVTVTSTMGYEAVVLGKPVFLLGNPFYDFHPLCMKIRSFDDAFDAFSGYREMKASHEEIRALVTAYFMTSFEGPFDLGVQYADMALVKRVADQILGRAARRST